MLLESSLLQLLLSSLPKSMPLTLCGPGLWAMQG